jgi:hypothetical protein
MKNGNYKKAFIASFLTISAPFSPWRRFNSLDSILSIQLYQESPYSYQNDTTYKTQKAHESQNRKML